MKDPRRNMCLSCGQKIQNPKVGVNFVWWPKTGHKKLCKGCARTHLTAEAFEKYFKEKK